MTVRGGPYSTIDESTAQKIKVLHKKSPRLGHRGIHAALLDMKLKVDDKELERFMRANRIKAEKPFQPRPLKGIPQYYVGVDPTHNSWDGNLGND